MLERILYVSRLVPGRDFRDICRIIRASHMHNPEFGVTGALICLDGGFVQCLEGPPEGLDAIYRRVCSDERHGALDLRIRERAYCRLFPGHAMALRTGPGLEAGLLAEFGYRPGFPVETFPAALLTEFVVSACHRHTHMQCAMRRAG